MSVLPLDDHPRSMYNSSAAGKLPSRASNPTQAQVSLEDTLRFGRRLKTALGQRPVEVLRHGVKVKVTNLLSLRPLQKRRLIHEILQTPACLDRTFVVA
jgi:hypothetical protein